MKEHGRHMNLVSVFIVGVLLCVSVGAFAQEEPSLEKTQPVSIQILAPEGTEQEFFLIRQRQNLSDQIFQTGVGFSAAFSFADLGEIKDLCKAEEQSLVNSRDGITIEFNQHLLNFKLIDFYLNADKRCVPQEKISEAVGNLLQKNERILLAKQSAEAQYNLDRKRRLVGNGGIHIDTTSFGKKFLDAHNPCLNVKEYDSVLSDGQRVKGLGMAVVYMDPGFQTSAMGHLAERFVYCKEKELVDLLIEFTPMKTAELSTFRKRYPSWSDVADSEVLKFFDKKVYIKARFNPGTVGVYGEYQIYNNRNIFETWLPFSGHLIMHHRKNLIEMYQEQSRRIEAREPLETYDLFKNSCVTPLANQLKIKTILPESFYKEINKRYEGYQIVYPSQRTYRLLKRIEAGLSNAGENFMVFSQVSGSSLNRRLMIYYPSKKVLGPIGGVFNVTGGFVESILGVLKIPFKGTNPLSIGLKKTWISLGQFVGIVAIHPAPTQWNSEELKQLDDEVKAQAPAVLPWIYSMIND